jgi:2-polyprenyl-3-methyl-5-hydroxy-6-metoxy-1,4-benzoquinol methylase
MSEWRAAQKLEVQWWGDCANTFGEELKQLVYAERMGMKSTTKIGDGRYPLYQLNGTSVLDIGGGPVSILLKTVDAGNLCVIDPADYPQWVYERYHAREIATLNMPAEDYACTSRWDEAWIYNVLQHVEDPEKVVAVARKCAKLIRIFEWIDIPAYPGHPHELKARELDRWLGVRGAGIVQPVDEELFGRANAYSGVFVT